MSIERIRYTGYALGVNGTFTLRNFSVGGFLCKAAGTITITDLNGNVVVDAVPVTAGQYVYIPLMLQTPGGTVTLASNAAGTLFV